MIQQYPIKNLFVNLGERYTVMDGVYGLSAIGRTIFYSKGPFTPSDATATATTLAISL